MRKHPAIPLKYFLEQVGGHTQLPPTTQLLLAGTVEPKFDPEFDILYDPENDPNVIDAEWEDVQEPLLLPEPPRQLPETRRPALPVRRRGVYEMDMSDYRPGSTINAYA